MSTTPPPLNELYVQTGERKNWNNPSPSQVAGSLNKAHTVNKALIANIDELRGELEATKKQLKWAKWKNNILMAILGGAAAEGMKVAVAHLIKAFSP